LDTGAELWRTDGVTWSPVITGGFGDINNVAISSLAAFNDHLYAGLLNEFAVDGGWQFAWPPRLKHRTLWLCVILKDMVEKLSTLTTE
jgi:hypothetical protein